MTQLGAGYQLSAFCSLLVTAQGPLQMVIPDPIMATLHLKFFFFVVIIVSVRVCFIYFVSSIFLDRTSCSPSQSLTHYIAKDDLELIILLHLPPKHEDYRHVPPNSACCSNRHKRKIHGRYGKHRTKKKVFILFQGNCLYPITLKEKFLFFPSFILNFIYLYVCILAMVLMWRSEDNGGSQVSSSIMCVLKIELEVVRFDSRGSACWPT